MKALFRIALFLLAFLPLTAAFGQTEAAPVKIEDGTVAPAGAASVDPITGQPVVAIPLTTIAFDEVNYDFGKIKEGETVKHKFRFTNTGTNDLILENVKPSCGCTALEWPKKPIPPGESGEIEAQFNSTGKVGLQNKYITVTLNSVERLERITFTGEVIPKSGVSETQTTAH
jgi:hypothetical protein